MKFRYKNRWLDEVLYEGSKEEMQQFMIKRGSTFANNHHIQKIPVFRRDVTKRAYGIYRK